MKTFYKFLFYKLYCFAVSNEKTTPVNWNFVLLASTFESIHIVLLTVPLKYYKIDLNLLFTSVMFVIIIPLFNYHYFIRNKRIEKINFDFQGQNRIVWKIIYYFLAILFFYL
jgi:hypothetical protein